MGAHMVSEQIQSESQSQSQSNDLRDWFIVQVQSGFERKVMGSIISQKKIKGLEDFIGDINIPSEEIVEGRKGKVKKTERKLFPGYLMVHADMNDEVKHMILQIPKVIDILGGARGEAIPVSGEEMARIDNQIQEGSAARKHVITFEIGEEVRICEGPFASFNGMVESVDEEKARLKVSISIFGRSTPVNLDYNQVEKT